MSLTYLQQRNIELAEQEIALLQKQVKGKSPAFCIVVALLYVIGMEAFNYGIEWLAEDKTFSTYVSEIKWPGLFFSWCFWFLVMYFWWYQGSKKQLRKRKKELAALYAKHGLSEKLQTMETVQQ